MIQFDTSAWDAIVCEADTAMVDGCFVVAPVEVGLVDPSIILSLATCVLVDMAASSQGTWAPVTDSSPAEVCTSPFLRGASGDNDGTNE
jgi:hypothetical protein